MREIISLCVGKAGNSIGGCFNEFISEDHGINAAGRYCGDNPWQLQRIDTYFQESTDGIFVPRSILIDTEPGTLERVRGDTWGRSFRPDNFIFGTYGSGNNFAKGYFTEGADLLEDTLEAIRREVELCDCLQGFQVLHGVGGGTGSGLGSLLLDNLRQEYPDRVLCSWTVMPSKTVSDIVVEPLNALLATKHLMETTDFSFCVENSALYNICGNVLKMSNPLLRDVNNLVAKAMCGITAAFRFPGQLNADLRKLAVSLVPFPRLHYFIPGIVPLTSRGVQGYRTISVPDLVLQMFNPSSMFTTCNPNQGKYITCAAIFRGLLSTYQAEEFMYAMQHKSSSNFAEWIPCNTKLAFCDFPPKGEKLSAAFIGNNTCIVWMWWKLLNDYRCIRRKKAFQHWYIGEGLDPMEFKEAEDSIQNMIDEYKLHEGSILL